MRQGAIPKAAHTDAGKDFCFERDLAKLTCTIPEYFTTETEVELGASVYICLRELGEITGARRVSWWAISDDRHQTSIIHEWCAINVRSQLESFQNVPLEILDTASIVRVLESGEPFHLAGTRNSFTDNLAIRQFFEESGVQSILILPVIKQGQLAAFITLISPLHFNALERPDIYLLKVFGDSLYHAKEHKLTELALESARIEAEVATGKKANFLASMSHEIRTPMTGVLGMIDLLRQTALNDDQKHILQTIGDSGNLLLTIINDILDFSKIEAGKFQLESIPVSLVDVVEGAIQTIGESATKKGLRLITYVSPDLPQFVIGDPGRIRQIILNLGSNAIKFTQSGQILIRAEHGDIHAENKVTVRISIKDQGIGISEQGKLKLFQPFSQAEESTSREFGGTGLGLTICKRLTELMGGSIGVDSTLGVGSEFHVSIPLVLGEKTVPRAPVSDLGGLNLLLVVGNPDEQKILQKYLEYWKTSVDISDELETTLDRCRIARDTGKPYDVVVLGPQWSTDKQVLLRDGITVAGFKCRFVFLGLGTRHIARTDKNKGVFLDVDPVRRSAFLSAVAIAASRESPEVYYEEEVENMKAVGKVLTVQEAREQGSLILVAEDNAINRDVIERQLNLLGFTCEIVEDGALALERWRNGKYAILLTDCNMPNMDGFDLTRAIRKDEAGTEAHARIIAITANALEGEAERCIESGMDDYVSKPVDMKNLREILNRWMPKVSGNAKTQAALLADKTRDKTQVKTHSEQTQCPIDDSVLVTIFGNDRQMYQEVLGGFIEPSKHLVERVQTACLTHSAEIIVSAAHQLKSAAFSIGAMPLGNLCQDLEEAGINADWEVIAIGARRLDDVMSEVERYINDRQ